MSNSGKPNISLDPGFYFNEVNPTTSNAVDAATHRLLSLNPDLAALLAAETTLAEQTNVTSSPLGDLMGFINQVDPTQGTVFAGTGFNTIFRPQSPKTPTKLPVPVPGSDNILELNLTAETLSFAAPLGNVPNRGFGDQGDITLNAIPYVQSINDITSLPAQGIHFEPGMWLAVPPTTEPAEAQTIYTRMASIPHGVTVNAPAGRPANPTSVRLQSTSIRSPSVKPNCPRRLAPAFSTVRLRPIRARLGSRRISPRSSTRAPSRRT